MSDIPALSLMRKIDEYILIRENKILDGSLGSYDEYRYLTGVLQGLSLAKNELVDMIRRYEQNELEE